MRRSNDIWIHRDGVNEKPPAREKLKKEQKINFEILPSFCFEMEESQDAP